MLKQSWFIVFALVLFTSLNAKAAPCDGSKSAFLDAISNDTALINETTDFTFGKEKTVTNTLGGLRDRSAARVIFTAPGSGTATKKATITITTSQIDKSQQILQFALGPIQDGFTSCAERAFSVNFINSPANNPTTFTSADLEELGPNDGTTSYVISTDAFGQVDSSAQTFGAKFNFNVIPGQSYEATCGSISEGNEFEGLSYDCNITISIKGSNGDSNGDSDDDDETTTPPTVEVTPEEVKIQPATMNGSCPLTYEGHLNIAIKTEQALKARMDGQAEELQDAIDAVSDAGVNPGPALRKLDALVEFVRDDIDDTRNVVKGGLEFSKRHLECAKQKTDNTIAISEINQAIVNDDAAITAINNEDTNINEESVRLKAVLEASSLRVASALADKEQAGTSVDDSYTAPSFTGQSVESVFDEFQANVAELAEQLVAKLEKQQEILKANNKSAATDAILAVQADDCIEQFFDEVVQEYTKVHTSVKEALKQVAEEAEANANSDSPDPDAPTVREGKRASRAIRQVDRSYTRTVKAVTKTKKKYEKTYSPSGLVGNAQSRFDRKVRTLLQLLRRAELAKDQVWRRLIRRELKKLQGVNVGI